MIKKINKKVVVFKFFLINTQYINQYPEKKPNPANLFNINPSLDPILFQIILDSTWITIAKGSVDLSVKCTTLTQRIHMLNVGQTDSNISWTVTIAYYN